MLRQAVELAERLRINEAEHNELIDQRNNMCRQLKAAGTSIKELQEVLGMSRSRVQQILRGARI